MRPTPPGMLTLRRLGVLVSVTLPSVLPGLAIAQDRGAVFSGFSAGEDRSAYLGGTIALPTAVLGHGPALRAIVSGGDYRYQSNGREIEGKYGSGDLLLMQQWSGAWGYANLGAGWHYTDTNLTPDDPGNHRQGKQWDVIVAADGARNFGPYRAIAYASYTFDIEDYYARADITRAVGTWRLGAEAVALGDRNYSRRMVGAVVGYAPASSWEVRLSGGYSDSDSRNGGYAALAFSRAF